MGNAQKILEQLITKFPYLPARLQQAAKYILNKPEEVAIRTMRALASDADVPPSTLVRLAHALEFENYAQLRAPFEQAMRQRGETFTERAQWLKDLADQNETSKIISNYATAAMSNLEKAFSTIDPEQFEKSADILLNARTIYVSGAGAMRFTSGYFHHVAHMALENVVMVDPVGGKDFDGLAEIGSKDAFLCTAFSPCATASVKTINFVKSRNTPVVVVADSPISPVCIGASSTLLVSTDSPQFFPSQTAVIAVLEALLAIVVSKGGKKSLQRLQKIEKFRDEQDFYWQSNHS